MGAGESVRVLVVDDSQPVRDTIRAMLEIVSGCEVAGEAGDGPSAVIEARRLRPDVVLMDINLPGCDGIRAAEQILETTPTRVIVISVENGREYFRRALQAGACDFLVKPFTPDGLGEAIRRALSPAQAPNQPARPKPLLLVGAGGGAGTSSLCVHLAGRLAREQSDRRVAVAAWGEGEETLGLLLGETASVALLGISEASGIAEQADAWDVLLVDGGRLPAEQVPGGVRTIVVMQPAVPSLYVAAAYARALAERPEGDTLHLVLNGAGAAGALSPDAVQQALGVAPDVALPEDAAVREAVNLGQLADLDRGPWAAGAAALLTAIGLSTAAGPARPQPSPGRRALDALRSMVASGGAESKAMAGGLRPEVIAPGYRPGPLS